MDRQLTHEFVETAHLPLGPLARHEAVETILGDPDMVGGDVNIVWNGLAMLGYREGRRSEVHISSVLPVMGRRVLKRVARTLEYLDTNYPTED